MKLYLVGGAVRDYFLGQPITASSDIDFAVEANSYEEMREELITTRGVHIWQERPEFVTIRGKVSLDKLGPFLYVLPRDRVDEINCDFTLCRAETMYSDKRHPDSVTPTDILTDLARRDFRMNAIAISEESQRPHQVLDPFNGLECITEMEVDTVGQPKDRFTEDPLRIYRALRFAITKKMMLSEPVFEYIHLYDWWSDSEKLPIERIYTELEKMFSYDTVRTLDLLHQMELNLHLFRGRNLRLKPQMIGQK